MSSIIRQIFNIFPRFSTKKSRTASLPFSILLMTFCVTSSPMIWSL